MSRSVFASLRPLLAIGIVLVLGAFPAPAARTRPVSPIAIVQSPFLAAEAPPDRLPVRNLSERVAEGLRDAGPWAPAAFVVLFVLACLLCLPTVVLAVAAGALWGVLWGLLYVWIGILLGSSSAFLVGRHLARASVLRRLDRHPRLWAIEEAVSEEGWKIVVLARLAPGSPFFLLNYLFGLTRIRFWPHLWATAFSVLPGTLLFVYLGSIGEMAVRGRIQTVWDWLLLGVGLIALTVAVSLVSRRARRLLDRKLQRPSEGPEDPERPEAGDGPGPS